MDVEKELKELWEAVEKITDSMTKIAGALETITEFNKVVVQKLEEK